MFPKPTINGSWSKGQFVRTVTAQEQLTRCIELADAIAAEYRHAGGFVPNVVEAYCQWKGEKL